MISDKLKIRLSSFVEMILINDALRFGFVKRDDSANINLFLNKVIPNLLELRKSRRIKIHDSIEVAMQFNADKITQEHIRSYLDTIIDKVYFSDEELDVLDSSIWLRPAQNKMTVYDEIETEETDITGLDLSTYMRSLLNEYSRLPQYKREVITFSEEMELIRESALLERVLNLTYNGDKYGVVVLNNFYGYLYDQQNYIVCYDVKNNVLKSFYLSGIKNCYLTKKKHKISEFINDAFESYTSEDLYAKQETYQIAGGSGDEEDN